MLQALLIVAGTPIVNLAPLMAVISMSAPSSNNIIVSWSDECLAEGDPLFLPSAEPPDDFKPESHIPLSCRTSFSELALVERNRAVGKVSGTTTVPAQVDFLQCLFMEIVTSEDRTFVKLLAGHKCVLVVEDDRDVENTLRDLSAGIPHTPDVSNTPEDWLRKSSEYNDPWGSLQWYYGSSLKGSSYDIGMDWVGAWGRPKLPWPSPVMVYTNECLLYMPDVHWFPIIVPNGQRSSGWDFADNDSELSIPVSNSLHGTGMVSIIGGLSNNDLGIVSSCPSCAVFCAKVMTDKGKIRRSAVIRAMNFSSLIGIRVGLHDYGHADFSMTELQAFSKTVKFDQIQVTAAGDNGEWLGRTLFEYPALYETDNIVVVGSTDRNGLLENYTNRGPYVQVFAPGRDVIALWDYKAATPVTATGSACSAALVASAVGHAFAHFPATTLSDMKLAISLSAPYGRIRSMEGKAGILDVRLLLDNIEHESPSTDAPEPNGSKAVISSALLVTAALLF
ncbi:MAG: uncharacterized protein KVP18_002330 [Porospora cf. gigantea A]|nr:MAG: hypothetical protein KVP18_002330 [Porospora cf. gigantea A]